MDIALTTRWNAGRHIDGEAMVEEILNLGFKHLELGYDLRLDLIEGVQKMVEQGAVTINSVHNYCPVPMGAPKGHPELYTFAHPEPRVRELSIVHTTNTIEFAQQVGAKYIVSHAGYVKTRRSTEDLFPLLQSGQQYTPKFDKMRMKFQMEREKKVPKFLKWLYASVEQLLPALERTDTYLCIENLPTWEATPNEGELIDLIQYFSTDRIKCWYDMGHGQIRENLGFINQDRWLERLQPFLAGMHIHDVKRPIFDHQMPGQADLDFERFKPYGNMDIVRVIEPTPRTKAEDIVAGLAFLKASWFDN